MVIENFNLVFGTFLLSDKTIDGVSGELELDGRDLASTYMLHPLTIMLSQISELLFV